VSLDFLNFSGKVIWSVPSSLVYSARLSLVLECVLSCLRLPMTSCSQPREN
jgi:hypothetical protein